MNCTKELKINTKRSIKGDKSGKKTTKTSK